MQNKVSHAEQEGRQHAESGAPTSTGAELPPDAYLIMSVRGEKKRFGTKVSLCFQITMGDKFNPLQMKKDQVELFMFSLVSLSQSYRIAQTENSSWRFVLCIVYREARGQHGGGWVPVGSAAFKAVCEARRTSQVCSTRTHLRHCS